MSSGSIEESALERFESNKAAWRRLDPDLKPTDLLLQKWAAYARPQYGTGFPTRAITERANEGGLLAKGFTVQAIPEWPPRIAAADRAVASLVIRQRAAVFANYFHLALPGEQRTALYRRYGEQLARLQPHVLLGSYDPAKTGASAFREALDRARWVVRALLAL